jgi:CelD/BcsL family acetyltransferase involved in cellulose biosynthesis
MRLTFVHDNPGFDRLAGEWNDLLGRSITDVPFLRHEYQRTWWSTLGGGEWERGALWLGTARDGAGGLQGIAPLFRTRGRDGRDRMMLLGSIEISDYLDLIVVPEATESFAQALLEALDTDEKHGPAVLDLFNIPEASPSLAALEAAAAHRGWTAAREVLEPCPVIKLPSDWETYLGSLESKQRHELRRKIRRAEHHAAPVRFRMIGPEEDLEAATERFLRLMAFEVNKIGFLTQAMRRQFHASVRAAGENGWLQMAFLEVGGEPAAGYLNFDYRGRIWVYNSGINPEQAAISPGWVLLAHLIRWAIEHGRSEFDFMRGDEAYKRQLGGVVRSICRLTLSPPGGRV